MKEEFCIMPNSPWYAIQRFHGAHRHEIFYGNGRRKKSIEYGIVVFLTPEMHNMSNAGVHFNHEFDHWLKKQGQKTAMKYYSWNTDDFIREFGKNYL